MNELTQIFPVLTPYIPIILSVMGVCAVVSAQLPAPTSTSNGFYSVFYSIINLIGQNYKHATNATDKSNVQ